MYKSRFSLLILGLFLCLSSVSEARVCFLGGGHCGGEIESHKKLNCKGMEVCQVPRDGIKPCDEGSLSLFLPENCCSNTDVWEVCDASEGKICKKGAETLLVL